MTPREPVTSRHEMPIFFPAGEVDLFGIFTHPVGPPLGIACILLSGGGATAPATNRNRLGVHLARSLAGLGYHVLRFDYHGVGESSGKLAGAPKVDEPFLEDLDAAISCVRKQGIDRLVLVGSCFGARTALSYAPDVAGVEGLILISPPLRDVEITEESGTRLAQRLSLWQGVLRIFRLRTIRGFFHPGRRQAYLHFAKVKVRGLLRDGSSDDWLSSYFLDPLHQLAERDVPVLFIYGSQDWHYRDFLLATAGRLGRLLSRAPLTEVIEMQGDVHALHLKAQEAVAATVVERLEVLARAERERVEGEVLPA